MLLYSSSVMCALVKQSVENRSFRTKEIYKASQWTMHGNNKRDTRGRIRY